MGNKSDAIRTECWNKSLDSLAYSYIYAKRIENNEVWLKWSKVLGILIPVLLGGVLSNYSSSSTVLYWAIVITSPFAIAQLVLSTYLTIIGADEKLSKYSTKTTEYSLLNSEFEQLAKFPIIDETEYAKKFDILVERERGIGRENFSLKDKELRMGMRYGLRNYRRKCAGCKEEPLSMLPTDCHVCGNF